jgi:multidrug efflux pump subunit AcrB
MFNLAATIRPYFGALVLTTLLLVAAGVYCATRLPSGVYPEVTFPRIGVVAKAPDLNLQAMEVNVTRELEDAVSSVTGVSEVRSKTIRGGSELSITCTPGTDMHRAEQLVWNHIGSVRSKMPANVSFTVEQMTPSVFPIMSVVLTGGDNPAQLRDYAFYHLAPRVKNVNDVYRAEVAGGDLREIEVIVRPDDLLAHGLSAADVADQIGQTSMLQPVGHVESAPLAYQVLVDNLANNVGQIENLVVSTRKDHPVRVKDVADVQVLHADRTQSIGYAQKDAVVVTVFRRVGGNTVNISHEVHALLDADGLTLPLDDAHKKSPRNIVATVAYDQSRFVESAVGNVRDAIVVGGVFSVLILMLFLRSWRATLISALAIPTTLAITFLCLYWIGETLNLMSLGGLAVAVGLIIDDTVVVVENIARHLTPGGAHPPPPPSPARGEGARTLSPLAGDGRGNSSPSPLVGEGRGGGSVDPVGAASKEITAAVIGSTLTTVLVFVPLAFIVGVYGQFFASLSWSLCIAVLVSMVISLTVVPVFAARFLAGKPMPEPGRIYRFFAHLYDLLLGFVLRFPWLTLTASLAAVLLGVLLYTGIPNPVASRAPGQPAPKPLVKGLETGLMPSMDEGAFVLDYWAPSGSPLEDTVAKARALEGILSHNPDVQAYVRRTGTENGLYATQMNRGDIEVVLRPADEDPISLLTKPLRPPLEKLEAELKKQGKELDNKEKQAIRAKYRRRPVTKVMEEIADAIGDQFAEHQLKTEMVQVMQDEMADLSGASRPIEVRLFGPDQRTLRQLAQDVADKLEAKGKGRGLQEVNSNVMQGNPDLLVRVDEERADRLGFKPETVKRQLATMYQGQIAAQAAESSLRITDVRVRYPDELRFGPGRFDPGLLMRNWLLLPDAKTPPAGVPQGPARGVPLAALAHVVAERTPDEQWRENLQPAAFITADLNEEEAGLGSVATDVRQWMGETRLPTGYRWELGGQALQQEGAFASLLAVMLTAVFLVYVTLAFQFRSAVLPLLIFLTQPLSIVSGLFALWITHTPLNVSSYMGAILLVGLDMKNGILLVEYIQKLRAEGMALKPALMEAGRTRFRPILMTSLAAILGLFPLALGIGPGAQMQQPLAIMVIGGLTANMLFTRAVIPAGYEVLDKFVGRTPAPPEAAVAISPNGPLPTAAPSIQPVPAPPLGVTS